MDNDVFRRTYRDVNERFCVYEKSILTNQCTCSQAERFCIAEREGVRCRLESSRQQCVSLLSLLREQSRFVLKTTDSKSVLPHGKAIRIQVGGLKGLYAILNPAEPVPDTIEDVYSIINRAKSRFKDLTHLPFREIVKQIAAYRGRRRSRSAG